MVPRSKTDIPTVQGQSQPDPAMSLQSELEQARVQALVAEPVIPLNIELHQSLSRAGGAKASTLKSAMASLERLRNDRFPH